MKILNERPTGMSVIDYHAEQSAFKKWLKFYKKGRLMQWIIKNGIKTLEYA